VPRQRIGADGAARKENDGTSSHHFEVIGKDGKKLQDFYSGLFGWKIDANNPADYGIVQRDGNTNADGSGSVAA
jgi:predicted enzyme related to lactoylglutathione lyase